MTAYPVKPTDEMLTPDEAIDILLKTFREKLPEQYCLPDSIVIELYRNDEGCYWRFTRSFDFTSDILMDAVSGTIIEPSF